jgi:hypothetical protein
MEKVGWEGTGSKLAGEYIFFNGMGNEEHELGKVFCT